MLICETDLRDKRSLLIILVQFTMFIVQLFINENKVKLFFTIMMILSIFHFKPGYILISIFIILSLWYSFCLTRLHPLKFFYVKVFNPDFNKNKNNQIKFTLTGNENIKSSDIKKLGDKEDTQKKYADDFYKITNIENENICSDNTDAFDEINMRIRSSDLNIKDTDRIESLKEKQNKYANNNSRSGCSKPKKMMFERENGINENKSRCLYSKHEGNLEIEPKSSRLTQKLSDRSLKSGPIVTDHRKDKIIRRTCSNIETGCGLSEKYLCTEESRKLCLVKNSDVSKKSVQGHRIKKTKVESKMPKNKRLRFNKDINIEQNKKLNDEIDVEFENDEEIIAVSEVANTEEVYFRYGFNVYGFAFRTSDIPVLQNILKEYITKKDVETRKKCFEIICRLFNKNTEFSDFQGGIFDLIEEVNNTANFEKNNFGHVKYIHIVDSEEKYLISNLNKITQECDFAALKFNEIEFTDDIKKICAIMVQNRKKISTDEVRIIFFLS